MKALLRKEMSVREGCRISGVSRKTIYKWRRRFMDGGRRGLRDGSRRPHRMPRRLGGHWIKRIRQWRRKHPHWGAKKLHACFCRQGWRPPVERTIARWLKRLGLVQAARRCPRKACARRYPALTMANRPHQVWSVDFKGWFRAGNGERCEPLTVRDLFSRYGLMARVLPTQQWRPVQAAFMRLFRERGMPEVIRVDNGGPFASTGPAGLSRLSVWWVRLGISVEFTRPGCPQDNGAHEQFHRVMKRETAKPAAWTRQGQQHRTTGWLRHYNQLRPHEALGQMTPAGKYRRNRRKFPGSLPDLKYGTGYVVRRVRSNGEIRWAGRKRFIGEAFVGQQVGLRLLHQEVYAVYFAQLLIGHLHERDQGAMRPTHYRHRGRPLQRSKV